MSVEGFERFVRANGGSLFRTAQLLTGNATDAEELVQDFVIEFGYLAVNDDDRVYLTFDGGRTWRSRTFAP